eukprot:gene23686-29931_t
MSGQLRISDISVLRPVLRCDIEAMIRLVETDIKQKNIIDDKYELKMASVELNKWITPTHQLNPGGVLTQSVYRQALVSDDAVFTRLRCSTAAEYDSDGVLRLKPHDPFHEQDAYYNGLLSFPDFWPLPKNHTGIGGHFFGLSCSTSGDYALRDGEKVMMSFASWDEYKNNQNEIFSLYRPKDSVKYFTCVMWALHKGTPLSADEFVVDLDGVDPRNVSGESRAKVPPMNHVTIAMKNITAVVEHIPCMRQLKDLPWKKDRVFIVEAPKTKNRDTWNLLPTAVVTMLDVMMDGDSHDMLAVFSVHDALQAVRDSLNIEERKLRERHVLRLAYNITDEFAQSDEFDWVEDCEGRTAAVLRDEALAALRLLLL